LLDQPYWGRGLATEIAVACLNFGFEMHNFERIIAFARPQNIASQKVTEKIGMRFARETVVFGVLVAQYELFAKDYYLNLNRSEK